MSAEPQPIAPAQIVAGVGASAGGVEALTTLVSHLPVTLEAAVVVVLHVAPQGTSVLGDILGRQTPLHVQVAADDQPVLAGHVYVAPPDQHVLVEDGRLCLSRGPTENGHRPAIDPLLRSIADEYGARSVGVILSGTRDDGTAGLARVKACGGTAFVQRPDDALYPGMPSSAIEHVDVDAVLSTAEIARELGRMSIDRKEGMAMATEEHVGVEPPHTENTRYTCPDCGGMLMRTQPNGVEQFRCSVGHVYSPESLDGEQASMAENAPWAGSRLLEDRAVFLNEMAERAADRGHERSAMAFRERAQEAQSASLALRGMLEGDG